jgi:hypothetical protein
VRGARRATCCALLLAAVAACAQFDLGLGHHATEAAPATPHLVAVRAFAAPERAVVLDPSFGFSLKRGAPGVPPAERAAAVGRAAAFALGDALTRGLRAAGIGATNAPDTGAAAPESAMVVAGSFEKIDQGRRRRVGRVASGAGESDVVADARLIAPNGRVLLVLHVDSARLADAGTSEVRGRSLRTADANRDAASVGREIARRIVDFARRSGWLASAG